MKDGLITNPWKLNRNSNHNSGDIYAKNGNNLAMRHHKINDNEIKQHISIK